MNARLPILLSLALLVALSGCGPGGHVDPDTARDEIVFTVLGMDCPGCHGGLEKNLEKIPGVAEATANWKRQQVAILLQEGASLDEDAVTAAILASNFTPGKRETR